MAERDTTDWLTKRGDATVLTLSGAKVLAQMSSVGWYIAPYSHGLFYVGKHTLGKYASRHVIADEAGQAFTFPTIDAAKCFMKEQLEILTPQVFDI